MKTESAPAKGAPEGSAAKQNQAQDTAGDRVVSDTGPFAIVPEWVLYHSHLSDRAVRLYGALARHADRAGACFPSRGRLASLLHCSRKTVDRALEELVSTGCVVKHARWDEAGDRISNLYVVTRALGGDIPDATQGHESRHGGDTDDATGRATGVPENESHLEREPLNEREKRSREDSSEVEDQDPARELFDKLKSVYPPASIDEWEAVQARATDLGIDALEFMREQLSRGKIRPSEHHAVLKEKEQTRKADETPWGASADPKPVCPICNNSRCIEREVGDPAIGKTSIVFDECYFCSGEFGELELDRAVA